MAEVGSQPRQAGLHVRTLTVPSDEAVNAEGVAEIVQARLPASVRRVDDADMLPEPGECCVELAIRECAAASGREQERAVTAGPGQAQAGLPVGPKRRAQG